MLFLDALSRVVHVGTAITLVGGSLFTVFVLLPSAKQLGDESQRQLAAAVGSIWKRFVHVGVLLFLVSGFYNYYQAIHHHHGDGLYHGLVGTKIILAFAVFFLSAALVGKSPRMQPIRDQRSKWLKVLVLLAATIVCISGFVKVRGAPGATNAPSSAVRTDAESDHGLKVRPPFGEK